MEYVDIKCKEEQKEKWRGTSEFIRKKSALNAIDTSKLVGKWEIKEIQIGKKSRKYKGSFYFEIVQEQETNLKKYRGRWNSPLLKIYGDFLYDKEKWIPSYN